MHACAHSQARAGFVFFIFLLVAIVRSPPTPMALRSDDVEALWLAVSHRLDNVSSTVLRQLHTLQSGVASHVHPLHGLSTETGAYFVLCTDVWHYHAS